MPLVHHDDVICVPMSAKTNFFVDKKVSAS